MRHIASTVDTLAHLSCIVNMAQNGHYRTMIIVGIEPFSRHSISHPHFMRNFLRNLSKKRFPYEPLISVNISSANIIHNLREFEMLTPHKRVAPVLKSNAYGHGLFEVAEILESETKRRIRAGSDAMNARPIPFFIVDSYFEAIALRSRGIKTGLLVIGYTRPETILQSRLKNTAFTITDLTTLTHLADTNKKISIHLKIDTGMHRQGLLPEELSEAKKILSSNSKITLEGITSHLSDAGSADDAFTMKQIELWNGIVAEFKESFPSMRYTHLSATDGHRYSDKIDANMSRLGIGLYGLGDEKLFSDNTQLLPAMEIVSIITGIKKLRAGETVGYGNTFKAESEMTIATIPVGYYEALDRKLSNKGHVLVGPERVPCRIVGRVSMNITTIDVTDIPHIKVGSPVVVISDKPMDPNSVSSITKMIDGSIPYEVVVKIPPQLKRRIL